jgi:hypothetical protein
MLNSAVQLLIETAMRLGFALLPIGLDKRPLTKSWKEFQRMRASREQVELWAKEQPPAWAIITGAISGVVVLDFDGAVGNSTMQALGLNPHVRTGSGGHHVYFAHPGWHVPTISSKSKRDLGERYTQPIIICPTRTRAFSPCFSHSVVTSRSVRLGHVALCQDGSECEVTRR